MIDKRIQIKKKWEIKGIDQFYFCSIGNLSRDPFEEIITLNYSEKLIIYNNNGKNILEMPFSGDVSGLFVCDLFDDGENVFVSMDMEGYIRVFSLEGKEIWKVMLHDAIITGIVDNLWKNDNLEIICILENNEIIVLNNDGKIILTYKHSNSINSCCVSAFRDINEIEIIFNDSKDNINFLNMNGDISSLDLNIKHIRSLAKIKVFDVDLLAVVNEEKGVILLDSEGTILNQIDFKEKVQYLASGSLFSLHCQSIVVIVDNNKLIAYDVEPLISDNFIIKSSSINEERKIKGTKNIGLRKIKAELNSEELNKIICPECGENLPGMLRQRILNDIDVFCEKCGTKLTKEHLMLFRA